MSKQETCACKYCGEATRMTGTKLCDWCWEIDRRLKRFVESPKGRAFALECLGLPTEKPRQSPPDKTLTTKSQFIDLMAKESIDRTCSDADFRKIFRERLPYVRLPEPIPVKSADEKSARITELESAIEQAHTYLFVHLDDVSGSTIGEEAQRVFDLLDEVRKPKRDLAPGPTVVNQNVPFSPENFHDSATDMPGHKRSGLKLTAFYSPLERMIWEALHFAPEHTAPGTLAYMEKVHAWHVGKLNELLPGLTEIETEADLGDLAEGEREGCHHCGKVSELATALIETVQKEIK